MAELRQKTAIARNTYITSEQMIGHQLHQQKLISDQTTYKRRLSENSQRDKITIYNQMIQMALRQKHLNLERIEFAASAIRLRFLKEKEV